MTQSEPKLPLYVVVRRQIVDAIASGQIAPGASLPSEMELARTYGVHQGTVRKAIDGLVADRVLVRRQGSGTFVAVPDDEAILFRFFRLTGDDGSVRFPRSTILSQRLGTAGATEASQLSINAGDPVFRLERTRHTDNLALLTETITLPLTLFPGIELRATIPNNIYQMFSDDYGTAVVRADERIKAIAASESDAAALGLAAGAPLLEITRLAYDISERCIELRVSRSRSDLFHYANTLR